MRSSSLLPPVVVLAMLVSGCGISQKDLAPINQKADELTKRVDALKKTLDDVHLAALNTTSPTQYELYDVARKKVVGYVSSDITIAKGHRVFLGDDLWDVEYVKVFTTEPSTVGDDRHYRVRSVQLLVSFGGKARDPEEKKSAAVHPTSYSSDGALTRRPADFASLAADAAASRANARSLSSMGQ